MKFFDTPLRSVLATACLSGLVALALPSASLADVLEPRWSAIADTETVVVVTRDADGEQRDTTIWLLVLDGAGYIRTGGSSWGENVKRDPELELQVGVERHRLRATFIDDEALRERITAAFREKYGWSDVLISPLRGRHPSIMRLEPL